MTQTLESKVNEAVRENAPENAHPSEWDFEEMLNALDLYFPIKREVTVDDLAGKDREEIRRLLRDKARAAYEGKETEVTPEILRVVEQKYSSLPIIDRQWVDHLYVMDHLKTGIGLRGYGQKDPRVEYEKEAFEIFESLKNNIADEAIKGVFRVQIEHGAPQQQMMAPGAPQFEQIPSGEMVPQPVTGAGNALPPQQVEQLLGPAPGASRRVAQFHTNKDDEEPAKPMQREAPKVGRNELCPCGSAARRSSNRFRRARWFRSP